MRRDGAGLVLAWSVRLLPRADRDWGTAMLAELDGIESVAQRWAFAASCTRAVLIRSMALRSLARRLPWVGFAVAAVVLVVHTAPAARGAAAAMMTALAVLAAVSRVGFGPAGPSRIQRIVRALALSVLAADALMLVNSFTAQTDADKVAVITVGGGVVLAAHLIAMVRLTADGSGVDGRVVAIGVGCGVGAAASYTILAFVAPDVPTGNAVAVTVVLMSILVAATNAARHGIWQSAGVVAGMVAGTVTAHLIWLFIAGLFPLFPIWIPNSAPPSFVAGQTRLVDPVGELLLGFLFAVALTVTLRRVRTDRGRLPDPLALTVTIHEG